MSQPANKNTFPYYLRSHNDSPTDIPPAQSPEDSISPTTDESFHLANLFTSPTPPEPTIHHHIMACGDVAFKDKFTGVPPYNSVIWIKSFEHFCDLKSVTDDAQQLGSFSLSVTNKAKTWLDTLGEDEKNTFAKAKAAFLARYKPTGAPNGEVQWT